MDFVYGLDIITFIIDSDMLKLIFWVKNYRPSLPHTILNTICLQLNYYCSKWFICFNIYVFGVVYLCCTNVHRFCCLFGYLTLCILETQKGTLTISEDRENCGISLGSTLLAYNKYNLQGLMCINFMQFLPVNP